MDVRDELDLGPPSPAEWWESRADLSEDDSISAVVQGMVTAGCKRGDVLQALQILDAADRDMPMAGAVFSDLAQRLQKAHDTISEVDQAQHLAVILLPNADALGQARAELLKVISDLEAAAQSAKGNPDFAYDQALNELLRLIARRPNKPSTADLVRLITAVAPSHTLNSNSLKTRLSRLRNERQLKRPLKTPKRRPKVRGQKVGRSKTAWRGIDNPSRVEEDDEYED